MSDAWLKDLGFERVLYGKNVRFYSARKQLVGSFVAESAPGLPFKIKQRAGMVGNIWLLVAKFLTKDKQIKYSIGMFDGQDRESYSAEYDKKTFQENLDKLLKRLKLNEK